MRSLSLDQLRALQAVVETAGFTTAARKLNLSQSAVSTQIKELEERFGVQLVERLGKKAFATAAGRELLDHASTIFSAVDGATAAMRRYGENWIGRVRIVCHETICSYLIDTALRELRVTHPNLEVVVMIAATIEAVSLVRSNDADLGVITMPVEDRALEVTAVYEEPLMAAMPGVARGMAASVKPHELAQFPLILDVARGQVAHAVRRWFADGGVIAHPVMELNAHEAVKKLIAGGFGAAILPRSALPREDGDIVARLLDPPIPWQLGLIRRLDKPVEPAMKIVRETIVRHLQERASERDAVERERASKGGSKRRRP